MDQEYINKITLECLLNPLLQSRVNIIKDVEYDDDLKFYKKRIIQLTKDMIKGNYPNSEIETLFKNMITHIIYYFKKLDTKDILQEEYRDLVVSNIIESNDIDCDNLDTLMFKKDKTNNLDKFVKKLDIDTKQKILPHYKQANIKDPKLKKKGVIKE
tara:strand:+ start:688 stop:1158 length:471 start_codon:yes stop_codon:yes gene_type:complete